MSSPDGAQPGEAEGAPAAVSARGLTKTFLQGETEVHALRGVDLSVESGGAFVAIMGPSGSGKSTLLHLIGALDSPTGGELTVAGVSLNGLDDGALTALRRDRIGFVFQFFNLLPTLTAAENVLLPGLIAGEGGAAADRVAELLDLVGLAERAAHLPAQLSGGEQQRISIARALLRRPEIVLADEPTGNLDSRSGAIVLGLLRRIADGGQTVVMVTHDAGAASRADRVIFLRDGLAAGEVAGGDTERVAASVRDLAE